MHTTTIEVDKQTWYVHHNGDWSGDAHVIVCDENNKQIAEYNIPGVVFEKCGRHATLNAVINAVERLY